MPRFFLCASEVKKFETMEQMQLCDWTSRGNVAIRLRGEQQEVRQGSSGGE